MLMVIMMLILISITRMLNIFRSVKTITSLGGREETVIVKEIIITVNINNFAS